MGIFDWFSPKEYSTQELFYSGVIDDNRTVEQKIKDFFFDEIAFGSPVNWTDKRGNFRRFPIFNQGSQSSCVPHAICKAVGINNYLEENYFVDLSRRDLYSARTNKPGLGTSNPWAMDWVCKNGLTLEQQMPSAGISEQAMNSDSDRKPSDNVIKNLFIPKSWLQLNPKSIDDIAFQIQQGKGVVLFFLADYKEWTQYIPKRISNPIFNIRHDVCAVDFTLEAGQKCIVIDDSWGIDSGVKGQRLITEDWFTSGRCGFAAYFEDLNNINHGQSTTPVHTFKVDIKFGDSGAEVEALQRKLNTINDSDGVLFPIVDKLGYFGGITMSGVRRLQRKFSLPDTGFVGEKTREVLNSI